MASKSNGLRQRRVRNTGNSKNNRENDNSIAEQYATNHDLYGPISAELLVDPVRIRGERTPGAFEKQNITRWLNEHGTSPTTRQSRTVADLEPANDLQHEIRELVRRYPNTRIVQDWLQNQPTWYTTVVAPTIEVMSRAVAPVRRAIPSSKECGQCCLNAAGGAARGVGGAVVGAPIGACFGCMCALGLAAQGEEDGIVVTPEERAAGTAAALTIGAGIGAVSGCILGAEGCMKCTGDMCEEMAKEQNNYWGGKRRRKTRKGRKKKKRKSRKHKGKHKGKQKHKKTNRRKYKKRRKTRKR